MAESMYVYGATVMNHTHIVFDKGKRLCEMERGGLDLVTDVIHLPFRSQQNIFEMKQ